MEITNIQQRTVEALAELRNNGRSLQEIVGMVGTNKTSVSDALNGNYNKVGDAMWKEWQSALSIYRDWQIFPTSNYKALVKELTAAKRKHKTVGITTYTGAGKTATCKWFARNNNHTYYIECNGDMTPRELLLEIQEKMKINVGGTNSKRSKAIAQKLKNEGGMLILDEFSSVKRALYHTVGTIVKSSEYYASVVIVGTEYLKSDFEACANRGQRGMGEIERRFCKNWVQLPDLELNDVAMICAGNGITSKVKIKQLFNEVRNFGELRDLINA